MRLSHIKLSGFKSFLEPITISFQSSLAAVVGPNGCGKSNIVDAIRWVIGESSAKQLRGDNMADVIFNGTTNRKPVGKASIELLFDNSLGRLGDKFSEYAEISIKREVSRDGQSTYFLNNTVCRRRDILDVLLGTGLGSRSYAIIEQGMISNLISAKPEELRASLEEAAGISKYKERRREAENRIKRTNENILRINDLQGELEKQLKHSKRQANAAKCYKLLEQEAHLLSAQIEAIEWLTFQEKLNVQGKAIIDKETELESQLAAQRHAETELEGLTQKREDQSGNVAQEQKQFYQFSTEIIRLEQSIQDAEHQDNRLRQNLQQLNRNLTHLNEQLTQDQQQSDTLQKSLLELSPLLEVANTQLDEDKAMFSASEEAMKAWQAQWDQFTQDSAKILQSVEVKQTQIQHLEEQIDISNKRIVRLNEEKSQLQGEGSSDEIETFTQQLSVLEKQLEEKQVQSTSLDEQFEDQKNQKQSIETALMPLTQELQALGAEQTSLKSLQKMALGHHEGIARWLENKGFSSAASLAEAVDVEAGWERALEVVLGDFLDAVCVENMAVLETDMSDLEAGVRLFAQNGKSAPKQNKRMRLLDKIQSEWPVGNLLDEVYAVETLEDAIALMPNLSASESVITKEGVWLGNTWLKTPGVKDERSGIIARKQRIEQLDKDMGQLQASITQKTNELNVAKEKMSDVEARKGLLQQESKILEEKHADLHAELKAKQAYIAQMQLRGKNLLAEQEEIQQRLTNDQRKLLEAKEALAALNVASEEDLQRREGLTEQKQKRYEALNTTREKAREQENATNQLKTQIDADQNRSNYLQENIGRTKLQVNELNEQLASIQTHLEEINQPLPAWKEELGQFLEKRLSSERILAQANEVLRGIDETFNELKAQINEKNRNVNTLREALEKLRIEQQSFQVHLENHKEQIIKLDLDPTTVAEGLPDDADKTVWLEKQSRVAIKIQKLGEINLAAIEESEQFMERKNYLDDQSEDLTKALEILDEAIRKIDRETRARLKETFEKVNEGFKTLFPKIFGGGQAYLELTENNLLTTGIVVKAQPPGKRNTSIHLLSGGEKALAAIALVFSLFQLNPAPFCILDEVDAPLDDHNIGRFCRLVEEMSESVQFIFISHNKVALSMAKQLVGVTMQEAGVSRVVAVDIEEAIEMAQQG